MATFEFIPGASWCTDRVIASPYWGGRDLELERALDVVDLFLDGTNVADRAGPDAIFCLTRDLLASVRDLALWHRTKALISFYEGPWELVLLREGDDVLVSFLRVGSVPEVVIQDHRVSLGALGAGVMVGADRLSGCLRRHDPSLAEGQLAREIDILGAEVRGALLATPSKSPGPAPEPIVVRSKDLDEIYPRQRLAFGFELRATGRDLLGPVIRGRSDLHALLSPGRLVARAGDHLLVVGDGRVFLQVERLLAALRHLLGAWERGRPMHVRLHGDTLQVGLRLTSEERVALSLGQVGRAGASIGLADLSVEEVARTLLSLGKDLRRAIKKIAPGQRHNPRFEAFRRDLGQVESWFRDLIRPSVVHEGAEPYQVVEPQEDVARVPTKVRLVKARRLSYSEQWWLEAEGLDIGGTYLCGDRVVVTARDTVMALDRDRGELLWRIEARPAFSLLAGSYGMVRLGPSGRVTLVDVRDGRVRWETELRPRAGPPAGAVVGGVHSPRCAVLAEAERSLVALDLNTGTQRWRFGAWRGRDFNLNPAGKLLLLTCGDSAVYALDAGSGELVWRHTARATFELPAVAMRDRVLACGGPPGGRDARLFCTDLASGRLHWVRILDVGVIGPAVWVKGDRAVVPCRHYSGGSVLVGLDLSTGDERWRRWLEDWGDYTLLAVDDDVVACGAGGMIAAVDADSGSLRWSHAFDKTDPDDMPRRPEPVLRGGALFVPADTVYVINPRDGAVIHQLGAEGDDPLIPDLLRVDERCGIYVAEDAGYLAAYGVGARLSVVR